MKKTWLIVSFLTLSGCATQFMGSAHVEGGRAACESKCRGQGMQLAGMVYMGEYSDACICQVPGATPGAVSSAAAATAGGAAGVAMQMQRQAQQQSAR